jgi:hypothetical protein
VIVMFGAGDRAFSFMDSTTPEPPAVCARNRMTEREAIDFGDDISKLRQFPCDVRACLEVELLCYASPSDSQ